MILKTALFFFSFRITIAAGVTSTYNGMGYCSNWGGGAAIDQYPTVQSCADRCASEFNSEAFAIYLRSWGYVRNYCECVPAGQSCSVVASDNARNYGILSSSPTPRPTEVPTQSPTPAPTPSPTTIPTIYPPTERPTSSPSLTAYSDASAGNAHSECNDNFFFCNLLDICDDVDLRSHCRFTCGNCSTEIPTSMPTTFPTGDCCGDVDVLEGVIEYMIDRYVL